jgi:hypothetical protein
MGMHQMHVLDRTGHSTTSWDPDSEVEITIARETFDALRAKNYRIFRVKGDGELGVRMETFDPQAGEMIAVPQLQGG